MSATDLDVIKATILAELKAQGFTQADLANYLAVSPKHVNCVLKGRQPGTFAFIERMAHAVGLSVGVSR
jgi:transcriptional regulator with XRE-family HTH domain